VEVGRKGTEGGSRECFVEIVDGARVEGEMVLVMDGV